MLFYQTALKHMRTGWISGNVVSENRKKIKIHLIFVLTF